MYFKEDWDKVKTKYIEYWNFENHDRPLLNITAPKENYIPNPIIKLDCIDDRWLDAEYVIKSARENMTGTYFGAESFPCIHPDLGPDIFGAFLGCDLQFGERTSWSNHIVDNWDDYQEFVFDTSNKWWKMMYDLTSAIVEDAKDHYLVGVTDLHVGADGLVTLRGPEHVCMDIYDDPEAFKRVNNQLFHVFKQVFTNLSELTMKYQEGTTNWTNLWHPGKWYVTSSDFICMISNEHFKEFILPEIVDELDFLDASVFHLDGPGALKHLDTLLEVSTLNGIQWIYGEGQPTAAHWIPVLKKIQDAKKLVDVIVKPYELHTLLEHLKPEGVCYHITCDSEEEAKYLINMTEKYYSKGIR